MTVFLPLLLHPLSRKIYRKNCSRQHSTIFSILFHCILQTEFDLLLVKPIRLHVIQRILVYQILFPNKKNISIQSVIQRETN